MRSDRERIEDILDAIAQVELRKPGSLQDLLDDEVLRGFIIRQIEVIGEAASNLDRQLRSRYHDVPWSEIVAMRNRVIHEYHSVDASFVWEVVQHDLGPLKATVELMLEEIP